MKLKTLNRMFWLVWNESKGLPKNKHWSLQEAKNEARRLSISHPGERFHVLALIGACTHQAIIWSEPDMSLSEPEIEDEIQF